MQLQKRIKFIISVISKDIFEKEIIFKLSMLAMLSGESIFLLGKPGIAKSLIARRIKFAIKDATIFEYLMNNFSTPEEIFGPISITALKKDKYLRIVDRYLPTANIAFLDEIWKASASILNNLLSIINEKIYRNSTNDIKVPLWLLISASNELPEENKGLDALYDRFIIRYIAQPLSKVDNFYSMLKSNAELDVAINPDVLLTKEEYDKWLKEIKFIKVSRYTLEFINIFRRSINEVTNGSAYISDRRWSKIVNLMKASAFYNNRKIIDKMDWLIIPYCVWDNIDQEKQYRKIFDKIFKDNIMLDYNITKKEIYNKSSNIIQKIHSIEKGRSWFDTYKNILNSNEDYTFYRLLGITQYYDYAFIKDKDFYKLTEQSNLSFLVNVYFTDNPNVVENKMILKMQYASKNQIKIFSDQNKKSIAFIEKKSYEQTKQGIKELRSDLLNMEKRLEKIKMLEKNEYGRLKKSSNIFFDEDLNKILYNYIDNDRKNKSIKSKDKKISKQESA